MTIKSPTSLTDEQHALGSAREIKALRELVSRRRKGEFISADEMDARLDRMIAEKRRVHGLSRRVRG